MNDLSRASKPAKDQQSTEAARQVDRRTFLNYVAGSISAFLGIVLGLPIVGYLAAPLAQRQTAFWLSLGKVDAFTSGQPKAVPVSISRRDGWRRITEERTCWVLASEGGQFVAYNGRCTHLGCAYSWKTDGPNAGRFFCPCHDGVFGPDGTVVAGPPPRELDRFDVRVEGGELLVLYQDYRLGVEQKQAV
jgi:quinol---cytochrome c reductase iron-sulfur subunit, bacillus type